MKHLIVYTHLNPGSFTRAVADRIAETVWNSGNEVKIVDLYEDDFNPVVKFRDIQFNFGEGERPGDIAGYQEMIEWADHITFVYPLWWSHMPAVLKGFIDRVFTRGLAFEFTPDGISGLLMGKKARVIVNNNAPHDDAGRQAVNEAHRISVSEGMFKHCGMDTEVIFFDNIIKSTEAERKGYLDSLEKLYNE